ncbi:MAG: hypothetical protein IJ746_01885 [Ruminococcus sp.]|nr:hypothetical protein [Ruminococcus sp.]
MRNSYVGLDLLDRVMKADSVRDMLKIMKPVLDRDRYKMLKRAVKTHTDDRGKRDCIIRYAEQIMNRKY